MGSLNRQRSAPPPELQLFLSTPIAHRGLHNNDTIPENSMAAFDGAIKRGIPIECDVQLLSDGIPAVFHDFDLRRATGKDGKVASMKKGDLSALELFNTRETIPTLPEVLEFVAGQVPLLIEIKNEGHVGMLEKIVADMLADYEGPVAIQAFNPFVLLWFKKNRPTLLRGQLSGDFSDRIDIRGFKKAVLCTMAMNVVTEPHFISLEINAANKWWCIIVRHVWRLPTLVWTVRSPQEFRFATSIGANSIFEGNADFLENGTHVSRSQKD